nr:integrating conjugative element protein [Pasteurella testudinis]
MKSIKFSIVLIIMGVNLFAHAELQVIADVGGESAVRFYEAIQPEHDETAPIMPHAIPPMLSEADMLPVVSHQLSPGVLKERTMDLAGLQPIFLVGNDNMSVAWLQSKKQYLASLHAIGLVVNVDSLSALIALREIAPELTLIPTPGDDLAERMNLQHYPVLITEQGLTQ